MAISRTRWRGVSGYPVAVMFFASDKNVERRRPAGKASHRGAAVVTEASM